MISPELRTPRSRLRVPLQQFAHTMVTRAGSFFDCPNWNDMGREFSFFFRVWDSMGRGVARGGGWGLDYHWQWANFYNGFSFVRGPNRFKVLYLCHKNITFVTIRCVLSSSKYTKTRFRAHPAGERGELTTLPQTTYSRLGREHHLPIPSREKGSRSRRLGFQTPTQIPGYAYVGLLG